MVKTNYSFEKRQRELAKKKKKEEKLREKAERKTSPLDVSQGDAEHGLDAPSSVAPSEVSESSL